MPGYLHARLPVLIGASPDDRKGSVCLLHDFHVIGDDVTHGMSESSEKNFMNKGIAARTSKTAIERTKVERYCFSSGITRHLEFLGFRRIYNRRADRPPLVCNSNA
jgi:hypothetical protein